MTPDRINAARTISLARYQEDGYDTRLEYLHGLADEHGLNVETVLTLADLLGPEEDFDGLVCSCEDAEILGGDL